MANTLKLSDRGEPIQLVPDEMTGREVGGYIIEEPLGEGGMGLVYRARHPILNRHFAIKVLRPEAAADARISGNFEREAQTLSSLKHPHIIDIVGFGTLPDGRQYMVMEFVKGRTLQEELEADGRIEVNRALKLADQILDGLDAAHSVGVIHRDMKPSNVLIARVSGGTEVLKLLDFGLAKQQPESLVGRQVEASAGASVIAGTPEYIAPEQALGKHAGKHSDIYSFGVVLFEMLTGFQPFLPLETDVDRVRSLLRMHLHEPAPLINTLVPGQAYPPELEELVADLLRKDPAERPSSAATVRARLEKVRRLLQRDQVAVTNTVNRPGFKGGAGKKVDSGTGMIAAAIVALLTLMAVGGFILTRGEGATPVDPMPPETPVKPVAVEPLAPKIKLTEKRMDPEPDPEVVAELVPSKPAPAVVPVAPKKVEPAKAQPPPKLTVSIAPDRNPDVQINKSGCEPNARWRSAAESNLVEVQQAAARLEDSAMWKLFEKEEASISAAIAKASTGVECDAVETRIEQLARKFKK